MRPAAAHGVERQPLEFTSDVVGVRLLDGADVDPFYAGQALRVARVIHENEVRRGTFLGFAATDSWLQRCGRLFPAAEPVSIRTLDAGGRRPTRPGTVGRLVQAHTGHGWQPAQAGLGLGPGWLLTRVEFDFTLAGPADDCTLTYARFDNHRDTKAVHVLTSTPVKNVLPGKARR